MLRAWVLAFVLIGPLAASAVPISSVRSAVGEADVRNAGGRSAWMPQVAANLVFEHAQLGMSYRSLAGSGFARAPFSVRVTTLRPGETRLMFADAKFALSIRASFLNEIP